MSEMKYLIKKVYQFREKRNDKTRVHDKDLAFDMAQAEAPYRRSATEHKKIGRALVSTMWEGYPDLKGDTKVTTEELSRRTNAEFSDALLTSVVSSGLRYVAEDREKRGHSDSKTAIKRHGSRVKDISESDPTALPHDLAQSVGYILQDQATELAQQGLEVAEIVQAQHHVSNNLTGAK